MCVSVWRVYIPNSPTDWHVSLVCCVLQSGKCACQAVKQTDMCQSCNVCVSLDGLHATQERVCVEQCPTNQHVSVIWCAFQYQERACVEQYQKTDMSQWCVVVCFSLESVCIKSPVCDKTAKKTDVCLLSGSKSAAEFYVFVGVIVMLYCIAALVLYIFFDDLYRKNTRIIIGVRIKAVLVWISSSSAGHIISLWSCSLLYFSSAWQGACFVVVFSWGNKGHDAIPMLCMLVWRQQRWTSMGGCWPRDIIDSSCSLLAWRRQPSFTSHGNCCRGCGYGS